MNITEGLELVAYIEERLQKYWIYLDRHRILVFYYKIACFVFRQRGFDGRRLPEQDHQLEGDLRTDLQCYSRLLHLIAHYELGNYGLLEY